MKRAGLLVLLILFMASGASSSSATFTVPDDVPIADDILYQTIVDGGAFGNDAFSWISASMMPNRVTGLDGSNHLCSSFDDENCRSKDAIFGHIVLPPCSVNVLVGCIDTLEIGKSRSTLKAAALVFEGKGDQMVKASPRASVPAGGTVSLWRSEGMGDFLVLANITYQLMKGQEQAFISNFQVNLIPASYIQDPKFIAPSMVQVQDGGKANISWSNRGQNLAPVNRDCLLVTDGYCFSREEFSEGTQAKVSLRVPNDVTGWLFGRMKGPTIEVKAIDSKNNLLTVDATSAVVPNLLGVAAKSEVQGDPGLLKWAQSFFYPGDGNLERRLAEKGSWGSFSSGTNKLELFEWWGERLKTYGGSDKRFGTTSRWMFGSTSMDQYSNQCLADKSKLIGLVTTNAPFYESGPPKLVDDVLNYVVAGPHHLADGKTLFKGVYDLSIRSEVARCIYNFSQAPLRAEISVTSSDGATQDIATEALTERNGWIELSAYNFHFSSPTVKVRFFQDKTSPAQTATTPKKSDVPQIVSSPSTKRTSATCVKGKLKKKPIAGNCPKGFKKA